jgi:hypothetical protein
MGGHDTRLRDRPSGFKGRFASFALDDAHLLDALPILDERRQTLLK